MNTCHVLTIAEIFQVTRVVMMLIISLLRYRVTVHPLKPAICRRNLKVVCGVVYLVGVIVACGTHLPLCFTRSNVVPDALYKFAWAFWIFFVHCGPTIFMAVVYCKIGGSLIKQNKYMKRVCSNLNGQPVPNSSFNILRYVRNRRTFLVCLATVLCYGIAHIPISVWLMLGIVGQSLFGVKFVWVRHIADILRVAGLHSANPFIYRILDKKLLTFWKCCCKKKRRTQEN